MHKRKFQTIFILENTLCLHGNPNNNGSSLSAFFFRGLRVEPKLAPCQGQASLCLTVCLLSEGWNNAASSACREKGQESLQLHWLEGVKRSYWGGGENFLQPPLGCTHPLVVEGNRYVDFPLSLFVQGKCCQFF